jgi:hypothetical protein
MSKVAFKLLTNKQTNYGAKLPVCSDEVNAGFEALIASAKSTQSSLSGCLDGVVGDLHFVVLL